MCAISTTMVTHISRSPEETLALGESWGIAAEPGWVIGLSGDLGSGKTLLARGISLGVGFKGRVHSPTFALANVYEGGRWPITHLDLYRLDHPDALYRADLLSSIESPPGICIVEWFDRWGLEDWSSIRIPRLRQAFIECTSEFERIIRYEDFGH